MGRSVSAKIKRTAAVIAAEREEAFSQMNPALRKQTEKCEKMLGDAKGATLRFYWKLGEELSKVQQNEGQKYGDGNPYELLETALQYGKREMRAAIDFAAKYNKEDLEDLIYLANNETGYKLHWGHVKQLLSLNTKRERASWAGKACRGMWDPKALCDNIAHYFQDRHPSAHGRRHVMPPTVHMQIRQIKEKSHEWMQKYLTVWNAEGASVITNILAEPPDSLTEVDLQNLEEIAKMLPLMQDYTASLGAQIGRAVTHVSEVIKIREEAAEAAARAAAGVGKESRSIQLEPTQPRRRRGELQPT